MSVWPWGGDSPTPRAYFFPLSHPLACPDLAPKDTHLYVTLGCIPFSYCELQWFIIGVKNLGDKILIPGVSGCSQPSPLDIFQL